MSFHDSKDLLNDEPPIRRSFEGLLVSSSIDHLGLRTEDIITLIDDISSMSFKKALKSKQV